MAGDVTRQFVIHSNESKAKFIDARASRYGNTARRIRENGSEKKIISLAASQFAKLLASNEVHFAMRTYNYDI